MKRFQPQPLNEEHAAAMRLQAAAPVLAFAVPVVLLVVAGVVGALLGDDAALPWLAAASPMTAVVVYVHDGDSPGLVALLLTAIASAPLWSMFGLTVAGRAVAFARFWLWYLLGSVAWVIAVFLFVPT